MVVKKLSLHIGVNQTAYSSRRLKACAKDADALQVMANQHGYVAEVLHDDNGTRVKVESWIQDAASLLCDGDRVLVTFSGHGFLQSPRASPNEECAWALFDAAAEDYWLREQFSALRNGVQATLISDCCAAGGILQCDIIRQPEGANGTWLADGTNRRWWSSNRFPWEDKSLAIQRRLARSNVRPQRSRVRGLPLSDVANHVVAVPSMVPPMRACVVHWSAAGPTQAAMEDDDHGYLTAAVLSVVNGVPAPHYRTAFDTVFGDVRRRNRRQRPHMGFDAGASGYDKVPQVSFI